MTLLAPPVSSPAKASRFDGMPYAQRLSILLDEDFLEQCAENELNPKEVLGLSQMSRADRCFQPVVLDRSPLDIETGRGNPDDIEKVVMACMSSNADKCMSCAEFMKRLRVRQILNTLLVEGTQTALVTFTAPSFGKVHRSNWSKKDVFRNRKKTAAELAADKIVRQKDRGKCPCGKNHTWEDEIVGTPIDLSKYNYVQEIIWTVNLPLLTKSIIRKIRYQARKLGISVGGKDKSGTIKPNDLRMFAVYERQLRGALHLHILLVVDNNSKGFQLLVDELQKNWETPTAKIPDLLFEWYLSDSAEARLKEVGINNPLPIPESIPFANWKKGELIAASKLGSVYDVQILHEDADNDSESESGKLANQQQASNYVAKYLGDNQGALSPEALERIPYPLAQHYLKLRKTAIALQLDAHVLYNRISTLKRKIDEEFEDLDETGETLTPFIKGYYQKSLMELLDTDIETNSLASDVLPILLEGNLTSETLIQLFKDDTERIQAVSLRGIKTRFNRTASNGGFSGALTVASNWRDSIASIRRSMYAYWLAEQGITAPDNSVWVFTLDVEEMELERVRRKANQYSPVET
jgi:hypothetical protein